MKKKHEQELPDSPIQNELEEKVREMLGPDYTRAPATLDTPPEIQAEQTLAEEQPSVETTEPSVPEPETQDAPEDPATVRAVNEIEHLESDRLLEAEDKELEAAFKPQKTKFRDKLKNFFSDWWHSPVKRNLTLGSITLILLAAALVPKSRYFMLNTFGVRASASIVVTDGASQQPLKNATVTVGQVTAQSDENGRAELSGLRLGQTELKIKKRAYAEVTKNITVGWGSNPLGGEQLIASGEQYTFIVTDYLSGKPIAEAEASVGGSDAQADGEGKILLATEPGDDSSEVTVTAPNYRTEKVKLGEDVKDDIKVSMVPSRKSVFVSKRSGKYDVYKIDIDGQNEELALAGSGVETTEIALLSHPTEEVFALVSTRENVRNKDGYLLKTLTFVDLNGDTPVRVAQAEEVRLLGWSGNKLYFVQTVAGASAGNPERQKLISYDYKADKSSTVASANYFNGHILVGDTLYYSVSSVGGSEKKGLYKVGTTGGPQQVQNKVVYNIYRLAYDRLILSLEDSQWHEHILGQSTTSRINGAPASPVVRLYIDSPDGSKSAWVDQRDGKGVLLLYNKASKEDAIIQTLGGLRGPIRWLSDKILVYRITNEGEVADYAFNIEGGEPKKITDVTKTLDIGE